MGPLPRFLLEILGIFEEAAAVPWVSMFSFEKCPEQCLTALTESPRGMFEA